jgi:surface protein
MFFDCEKFNQDLSSWDTHQAELMYAMFSYATQFLGIGLEYWNTSNVSNMNGMFREAKAFNSNISGWDVHNVQDTANMVRCKT